MKKTYINPAVEIIYIETVQMIAESSLGFGEGVTDASGAESRDDDFDLWSIINDK